MNKLIKIIDAIVWVLATIGMIAMVCALYELKEIQNELDTIKREHHVIIEYKIGADTIYKIKTDTIYKQNKTTRSNF